MSTVHEHVKKGASEQQQERQVAKHMRPVLGDQVEPGDRHKRDEHNVGTRPAIPLWRLAIFKILVVLHDLNSLV